MISQVLFAGFGIPLRVVDAADFDGTNDYLSRGADLTGSADSKLGILSAWVRIDGNNGVQMWVLENALTVIRFELRRSSANTFIVQGKNSAGTTILSLASSSTYLSGATWLHILASWDLATAGARSLYISDVSDLGVVTFTDDSVDYTTGAFNVGASPVASPGDEWNGAMAEVYFAPGQYLDMTNASNRRKFISATGKPVHLGATGALPTGTAPLLYLHLDDGEAVANFATNRGTGGNLSITGSLDTASTSPSD